MLHVLCVSVSLAKFELELCNKLLNQSRFLLRFAWGQRIILDGESVCEVAHDQRSSTECRLVAVHSQSLTVCWCWHRVSSVKRRSLQHNCHSNRQSLTSGTCASTTAVSWLFASSATHTVTYAPTLSLSLSLSVCLPVVYNLTYTKFTFYECDYSVVVSMIWNSHLDDVPSATTRLAFHQKLKGQLLYRQSYMDIIACMFSARLRLSMNGVVMYCTSWMPASTIH